MEKVEKTIFPRPPPSEPPPAYASEDVAPPVSSIKTLAALSTHGGDRISLLNFPEDIKDLVRETIRAHAPGGFQSERTHGVAHEFKLKGYPFWELKKTSGSSEEKLKTHMFMCNLLKVLATHGWSYVGASNFDQPKRESDERVMLFRNEDNCWPEECEVMCVLMLQGGLVRLINASPKTMHSLTENVVERLQTRIATEKKFRADNSFELKLTKDIYTTYGKEAFEVRLALIDLLRGVEAAGWTLYLSEECTWYCCYGTKTPL